MDNEKPTYQDLIARCDELESQLMKYLKIEQDLSWAKADLDRDIERFESIQSYSQEAIQADNMPGFAEITLEYVLSTFELEFSLFFTYNPGSNKLELITHIGLDDETVKQFVLGEEWVEKRKLPENTDVTIEQVEQGSEPFYSLGFHRLILAPIVDEENGLAGLLLGGVTERKKDYFTEISEALVPAFTVFAQQMNNLLRNLESKLLLDEKVKLRTAEVMRQKEELQITLDNLQQTQKQLIQSEKMASLGSLVAGVAHEINTPVGISVTAASKLAEETRHMADRYKADKISRAEFKDYLNTANQSANLILANMERTATMVQSFKQVSVDQSTEQKREFKLKDYTEDVIRSLYPRLKEMKVKIDLEIHDDLELDSYPGAFSQILTNLILNSLVHGFEKEDKGEIRIKSSRETEKLVIEYSDNGKGFPPENQEIIFEPFFTTNKKAGTGLGLHIVYNLVTQKLNGSILAESIPFEQTLFRIYIPFNKMD